MSREKQREATKISVRLLLIFLLAFFSEVTSVQQERRRTEILGSNLRVAYSIIFANFCDRELQNRLEHRDDFISKVENNPIELLAAIKERMHTAWHEKLTFPYETLWTSLGAMFKLKQEKMKI